MHLVHVYQFLAKNDLDSILIADAVDRRTANSQRRWHAAGHRDPLANEAETRQASNQHWDQRDSRIGFHFLTATSTIFKPTRGHRDIPQL